jgi:hypothetical protein
MIERHARSHLNSALRNECIAPVRESISAKSEHLENAGLPQKNIEIAATR